MTLCRQVIDFVRRHLPNDPQKAGGIGHIPFVQKNAVQDWREAQGTGKGGAPDDTVYLISFLQQKLCQIGTVLTGDPGDQRFFHVFLRSFRGHKNPGNI